MIVLQNWKNNCAAHKKYYRFQLQEVLKILIPLVIFFNNSFLCSAESIKKSIFLAVTSDLHGWLSTALIFPKQKRRGLLHIVPKLESLKKKYPGLILIDAGDLVSGSPLSYFYHSKSKLLPQNPFFKLIQKLQYDVIVIGNHDLEINPLFEKYYLLKSNLPWIAANLFRDQNPLLKPYITIKRSNIKITILGITTPGVMMWVSMNKLQGLKVTSIAKSLQKWVPYIHEHEKPDILIGVFHAGLNSYRDDYNSKINRFPLANEVLSALKPYASFFDLIISGHDHILSPNHRNQKIRNYYGVPALSPGKWGNAFQFIQINLLKIKKEPWLKKIKVQTYFADQTPIIEKLYKKKLAQEYWEYLEEALPWKFKKTTNKLLSECFNQLTAAALDKIKNDGIIFPFHKIKKNKLFTDKILRRKNLLRWFPYQNYTVTVQMSKRDLFLLTHHPNDQKSFYRYRIFAFLKKSIRPLTNQKKTLWLDNNLFKRQYNIITNNYLLNGGKGILSSIFLNKKQSVDYEHLDWREELLMYLKTTDTIPKICESVLERVKF